MFPSSPCPSCPRAAEKTSGRVGTTIVPSCPTRCETPVPSNRMPTWCCSSTRAAYYKQPERGGRAGRTRMWPSASWPRTATARPPSVRLGWDGAHTRFMNLDYSHDDFGLIPSLNKQNKNCWHSAGSAGCSGPATGSIAACSGGADSMALLLFLYRCRRQLAIEVLATHVDHGIRGEASRRGRGLCAGVLPPAGGGTVCLRRRQGGGHHPRPSQRGLGPPFALRPGLTTWAQRRGGQNRHSRPHPLVRPGPRRCSSRLARGNRPARHGGHPGAAGRLRAPLPVHHRCGHGGILPCTRAKLCTGLFPTRRTTMPATAIRHHAMPALAGSQPLGGGGHRPVLPPDAGAGRLARRRGGGAAAGGPRWRTATTCSGCVPPTGRCSRRLCTA